MDVTALIDGTAILVVLGGCLWALGALFFLALGRSAALGDEAMFRYLDELYGKEEPEEPYDQAARDWIAAGRRAS